jgi:hypothetical protein
MVILVLLEHEVHWQKASDFPEFDGRSAVRKLYFLPMMIRLVLTVKGEISRLVSVGIVDRQR